MAVITRNRAWPRDREIPSGPDLPASTVIVSSDSHYLELADWAGRMPVRLRDRAPRWWFDDRGYHFEADGKNYDSPDLPAYINEGRPGMWDLDARIKDLDAEGVSKEFLYPQRIMGLTKGEDYDYIDACLRVYNEGLSEFCGRQPDRLYGIGLMNYWNPAAAHDSLEEMKALGFRAVMIPSLPPNLNLNDPSFEPLWDAVQESGLPLSFHIGETYDAHGPGGFATRLIVAHQPFRRLWTLLTMSGILERHPSLRVVFAEGGISWVPSALYDADRLYEEFEAAMNPRLAHLPSYYWFQNCYATFQEDPRGLEQLRHIGADRVLWATDYPHPESTLGFSRAMVREIFDTVGEETGQDIVAGNTLNLYGLN